MLVRTRLDDTPYIPGRRLLGPSGTVHLWMRLVSGRLDKTRTKYFPYPFDSLRVSLCILVVRTPIPQRQLLPSAFAHSICPWDTLYWSYHLCRTVFISKTELPCCRLYQRHIRWYTCRFLISESIGFHQPNLDTCLARIQQVPCSF